MSSNIGQDQLALIRIEGMHCHKCERAIQKSLLSLPGVHEVEVDFNSRQASVLYSHDRVTIGALLAAVNDAGYSPTGYTPQQADTANH